jgi:Flp pilus assembly pilin Flp
MRFLKDENGQSIVEWLVVVAIIIAVVGGILLTLSGSIRSKLEGINNAL